MDLSSVSHVFGRTLGGSMKGLENKIALVTGGGRGIGRAICLRLAQEGMDVAVNELPEKESLQEAEATVQEIRRLGRRGFAVGADIGQWKQVESMKNSIEKELGEVFLLVNNAAYIQPCSFAELTEDLWNRTLQTNLTGMFICCKCFGEEMCQRRSGKIVNMGSISSVRAGQRLVHYCVSKAGVLMLTQALALEFGSFNVNVNAVGPGLVPTRVNVTELADPKFKEQTTAAVPLKRLPRPEDVAAVVAFLASEDARHVHAHLLAVDGGLQVQTPGWV